MCLMRLHLETHLRTLIHHRFFLIACIHKCFQSHIFLETPLMMGDVKCGHPCDISLYDSRVNGYHSNGTNLNSVMLGVESKGKSLEKELFNLQEETTMSFSLNPSPLYYEISYKELRSPSCFGKVKTKGKGCRRFCELENFVTTFPRFKCDVV
ncbi:hypothetical protein M9H77_23711 [Catharanthus roseus]|uniref:Uncharacterized protein n=1 Tax=Catharanthus roseus TaxID=4058 RepID=A0ACC0AY80_CATRO|nr:hypothetical protein M9H77_23711 [Catharanthus roseus]